MTKPIKAHSDLLATLTTELKSLNLWQQHQPSAEQLASNAPFCFDTLSFEQWLQFIFIPKITQMIELGQALPANIDLSPMAEESFRHLSSSAKPLLAAIKKIDQVLSQKGIGEEAKPEKEIIEQSK